MSSFGPLSKIRLFKADKFEIWDGRFELQKIYNTYTDAKGVSYEVSGMREKPG